MNDPETLRLTARFAAVADEDLSAAYDMGVQDAMLRAAQIERILRDLIDTLRFENASPFDPWIRRSALGVMADEAGVRLSGVSPVVSPAVAAHDEVNPPADDSACPLCNTEWSVTCVDCERTFQMRASEERAFYVGDALPQFVAFRCQVGHYRFHRCGTDRRPDER